jgi:hypothetical protein
MTAPSPATLRMRRHRERRRQGDVTVRLDVGANMTADLADLGWVAEPDRGDKDALTRALVGLINQAIAIRVTPTTGSEGVCFTPLRATPGPIAIGLDESAGLSPKLGTPFEQAGLHVLGLGCAQPGEVLEADGVAEIVEDKPLEAQPCDRIDIPAIAIEQAEVSSLDPVWPNRSAEPTQPFEVDPVHLWVPRLTLWQRSRIWAPEWGRRPDQDGCLAPDYLL